MLSFADNITVNGSRLYFAGHDTVELAKEFGTPLYVLDENKIRENCRVYTKAFKKYFKEGSRPLYASKANSFKAVYQIMNEEGMGIDVVSCGEIYTAKAAGYDLEGAYFHGSCKTAGDIRFAMDCGVGVFVCDSEDELLAIEEEAAGRNMVQKVMLRITPGIDPHTYEAVATGKVDSKFGTAIETGQALELTKLALGLSHIVLTGFHCHVGSQVFFEDVYERTAEVMMAFIAEVKKETGYTAAELNLGGGFGVPYTEADGAFDIDEKLEKISNIIKKRCEADGLEEPVYIMEPGRSIVAAAGMTLYTVGSIKKIPGFKNYVITDGGMGDNPRYALYKSKYTCICASRADEPCALTADVAGRCCESGDIIQPGVSLPGAVKRGDIIAVCTTGAYNYSMASNYNRLPRPACVMVNGKEARLVIRRESFEDLVRNDIMLGE